MLVRGPSYIVRMIEQVIGHLFEYDKTHKVLRIVADLTEIGVPPAGLGKVVQHLVGPRLHLHHVLLHVLLLTVTVLHLQSVSFSVLSLGCARTVRSVSGRRE